jgi:SAM-dependent methyltransferase
MLGLPGIAWPSRAWPPSGLQTYASLVLTRAAGLAALSDYQTRIQVAIAAAEHHDQRRAILQELLRDGFALSVEEITLEHNVRVEKTRGRIDLLYGSLAWEVKRDLDREREDLERELKLYLTDLGVGAIGIGTDGLRFEAYQLDAAGELHLTDAYAMTAETASLDETLDWLDAYIFALDDVAPTTESILTRFGLQSAVFRTAEVELQELWTEVASDEGARIKRDEWEGLLEVVYGAQVASDQLWLRHTYLVMVARLLAFIAIVEHLPPQGAELGALTGDLFAPLGLPNLVERDFFAWPAEDQIAERARHLLRGLAQHLGLFSIISIDEDLLKELYEHMVDPAEREWLGEFYTPDWLADFVLERAGFGGHTRMLDPGCGSGTFLFAAIRRLRDLGLSGAALVHRARQNVLGFDIHPLAVTIARANYVLALRGDLRDAGGEVAIPVFMADTLAVPTDGFGRMVNIATPVEGLPLAHGDPALPSHFELPTERAEAQTATLAEIVTLVDQLSDPALAAVGASDGLEARLTDWNVPYLDVWKENLRLLRALREGHRDTIWSFVLTNAARPHEIAADPVDLVVGNPPWLTLHDMAGSEYRGRVRAIADEFNLVPAGGGDGSSCGARSGGTGPGQKTRAQRDTHFGRQALSRQANSSPRVSAASKPRHLDLVMNSKRRFSTCATNSFPR